MDRRPISANPYKDKKSWGPGPWQNEPDLVEFEEYGLKCRVQRGPVGALNGYVGVPPSHPCYGASASFPDDYFSLTENEIWWKRYVNRLPEYILAAIDVHGGFTYSTMELDGLHWFGFDCAHAGDLCPQIDAVLKKQNNANGDVYRDIEYVTNEVKSLVKQLAAIK